MNSLHFFLCAISASSAVAIGGKALAVETQRTPRLRKESNYESNPEIRLAFNKSGSILIVKKIGFEQRRRAVCSSPASVLQSVVE